MTINEKNYNCEKFFEALCDMLSDRYEMLKSCNRDMSAYLCPIGTTSEVTYYSKPEGSFRISDHWNWYGTGDYRYHYYQIAYQSYCGIVCRSGFRSDQARRETG